MLKVLDTTTEIFWSFPRINATTSNATIIRENYRINATMYK